MAIYFEYLQRRLYILSGQPVPVIGHPLREKAFLHHAQTALSAFQLVPIASCLVPGRS